MRDNHYRSRITRYTDLPLIHLLAPAGGALFDQAFSPVAFLFVRGQTLCSVAIDALVAFRNTPSVCRWFPSASPSGLSLWTGVLITGRTRSRI